MESQIRVVRNASAHVGGAHCCFPYTPRELSSDLLCFLPALSWVSLKYPMKREIRAKLAKLYFELSGMIDPSQVNSQIEPDPLRGGTVLPGMDARLVDISSNMCISLLESKKRIDIVDLQLNWRSVYQILVKELFPKQRKTGLT